MAGSAEAIVATLSSIDKSSFSNPVERIKAKDALFAALRRVQEPWDVVLDHVWEQPTSTASIKTLIDADFWKKWAAAGGQPSNTETLARVSGVDPILLKRLLRYLAGQHFVEEAADGDTYSLTDFTRSLGGTTLNPSTYTFLYALNQPCLANFPKYAAEAGYKNPADPTYTNFNSWKGKDQTLFTMLAAQPQYGAAFNDTMTVYANVKTPWINVFPIDREVIASGSLKTDRPIVVDVAGGVGHDLEKVRAAHPTLPAGSLVLQDLANVLDGAIVTAPITKQPIDFMTPQPVKGAAIYYLHCVLHDWPDDQAVKILDNIKVSMEKGYSRILLHESVVKPVHPHPRTSLSDVVMMMCFSAIERDEGMWYALAEKAGLKVTKIWTKLESVESIIQLELP